MKFLRLLDVLTGRPEKRRPAARNLERVPTGWKRSLVAFGVAGGYGLVLLFGTAEQLQMLDRVVDTLQQQKCDAVEPEGPPPPPPVSVAPPGP